MDDRSTGATGAQAYHEPPHDSSPRGQKWEQLIAALTGMMAVLTRKTAGEQQDEDMLLSIYAQALQNYPIHLTIQAIEEAIRTEVFLPPPATLINRVNELQPARNHPKGSSKHGTSRKAKAENGMKSEMGQTAIGLGVGSSLMRAIEDGPDKGGVDLADITDHYLSQLVRQQNARIALVGRLGNDPEMIEQVGGLQAAQSLIRLSSAMDTRETQIRERFGAQS